MNILHSFADHSPILVLFLIFWFGLISSFSACAIVRIPVIFGYLSFSKEQKSFSFLICLGLAIGIILGNMIVGFLVIFLKNFASKIIYLSEYVYIFFGLFLLSLGVYYSGLLKTKNDDHACKTPKLYRRAGFAGAMIFGTLFTFIEKPSCPSCASMLFVVIGIATIADSLLYSFAILLSFAVGQGVSILVIGRFFRFAAVLNSKMGPLEPYIQFFSSIVLILFGLYFLMMA